MSKHYTKRNYILLLVAIYMLNIFQFSFYYSRLDKGLNATLNNPNLLKASIFASVVIAFFQTLVFLVVFSIYYRVLRNYLKNHFEEISIKKYFMFFSALAVSIKLILRTFISFVVFKIFEINNIQLSENIKLFENIEFVLNVVMTLFCIYILYAFTNNMYKLYRKDDKINLSIIIFYTPYLFVLSLQIAKKIIFQ